MLRQPIVLLLAFVSLPIINGSELKLVQVLCRHGDRAPLAGYEEWYPTDPHINEKYAPAGPGQLTEEGRNRSFALGEFLRRKYFSQLQMPPKYSGSFFRARSSDVDRCRESAEAIAAALFPDSESIPICHQQWRKDILFLGTHICPAIRPEMAKAEKSIENSKGDEAWLSLRAYLTRHLGVNATRRHAFFLYHTLMAQSSFGLPLPNWTTDIYPSLELEKNAGYEYIKQSYSTKLKRVNGGLWIREFIENMNNVASGKDLAKILVYVGHETNIAGFLKALDIFQPHVPSFCSCVILEMYQNPASKEHQLRLFHRNSEKSEELQIPGCSPFCLLEDFESSTRHLVLRSVEKECGLKI